MKILQEQPNNDPKLVTQILRKLEQLTRKYDYTVPGGWQAIVQVNHVTVDVVSAVDLHLHVQSNQGGGNFASAKMAMLENEPRLATSGESDPQVFCGQIARRAQAFHPDDQEKLMNIRKELFKMKSLRQMPSEMIETLGAYGFTAYAGAIRVLFERLVPRANFVTGREKGEILISFSGAKEWQDLFFAASLLKTVQQAMSNDLERYGQTRYNLYELKRNPETMFWIDALKLEEA